MSEAAQHQALQIIRKDDDLALTPIFNVETAQRRLEELQKFVKFYLKEGEDFGTIPGTPKPTLYKPGADKLCDIYALSDTYRITNRVEDWTRNLFDYEIECTLASKRTGTIVSTGVGSCNSYEGRYRWRELKRVCPICDKATIIKGRAQFGGGWVCWQKEGKSDGCGQKFSEDDPRITSQVVGRVENEDIPTLKNTLLKMAKKRAKVDAVLSATRSSGLFTQDIEDWNIQDEGSTEAAQAVAKAKIEAHKAGQTINPSPEPKAAPSMPAAPANGNPAPVVIFFSYPYGNGDICIAPFEHDQLVSWLSFEGEAHFEDDTTWRVPKKNQIALFDYFKEIGVIYKELQSGSPQAGVEHTAFPLIEEISKHKSKQGSDYIKVKWAGKVHTCFNSKLYQYLVKGKQADLIIKEEGKFSTIVGLKRVGDVTFDENGVPEIQRA